MKGNLALWRGRKESSLGGGSFKDTCLASGWRQECGGDRRPARWAQGTSKEEELERWPAACLAHSRCSVSICDMKSEAQLWSFLCDLGEGAKWEV